MVWTEAEPVAQGIKPPNGRDWFKRVKVRFDWVANQGTPWWEKSAGPVPQRTSPYEEVITSPQAKRIQISELVQPWSTADPQPGSLAPQQVGSTSIDSEIDGSTQSCETDSFIKSQLRCSPVRPNISFQKRKGTSNHTKDDSCESGSDTTGSVLGQDDFANPATRNLLRSVYGVSAYPLDLETGLLTPPITPPSRCSSTLPIQEKTNLIQGDTVHRNEPKSRTFPGEYTLAPTRAGVNMSESVDP
jgi:hypothetical protein